MAANNHGARKRQQNGKLDVANGAILAGKNDIAITTDSEAKSSANTLTLLICVGGIYASLFVCPDLSISAGLTVHSLTWGFLQERITTTNYGTETNREVFKYPVVVNTVQSAFACLLGYVYVRMTRETPSDLPIFPSRQIAQALVLVSLTSSLSSPFGYASLAHVDYITFILAKSCKLLPVMLLHVTLYRKKYPFYKYAVVGLVTAGVAVFTLYQSSGSKKKKGASGNSIYGLMLLSINLLFDGLTNSTQDDIYARFRGYTGQQMMCALNFISTVLTTGYLLLSPYLVQAGVGAYLGIDASKGAGELRDALLFVQQHPTVGWDILGFAVCGALGQVFIFMTLSTFGSLLLVTVTVTRKMLTMILSVVWFGHSLTGMQWLGVGLVFSGIGIEAELNKREKKAKELAKRRKG